METIVWGFPNAFGVFLNAYLNDPYYSSQDGAASLLPLIGPLSSGIMYCSGEPSICNRQFIQLYLNIIGSVIYPFTSRYPQHRRTSLFIGAIICWASLFGASYATKANIPTHVWLSRPKFSYRCISWLPAKVFCMLSEAVSDPSVISIISFLI